jgi:hypothetical protein
VVATCSSWSLLLIDSAFKNFEHNLSESDVLFSTGQNISKIGNYRPDISIKNKNHQVCIVLESEQKSDRKAFIGALTHAFKFADEQEAPLTLVFVMKETRNQTTVTQISNNIRPYYEWLQNIVSVRLINTFLISDVSYEASVNSGEKFYLKHLLYDVISYKWLTRRPYGFCG